MAEWIRTFIAIELDDTIHRALAQLQAELKFQRVARLVRWVAPDGIHITVKFLGDVDSARMPALQHALAEACMGIPSFTLTIGGIGAFPDTRRPNNVWIGASGQIETAVRLAQRIEDACAALGFQREERPFTPHLTLGRVKRDVSLSDRQSIGEMVANAKVGTLGVLHIHRVSVMKSELKPTGSVYTRLAEIPLTQSG